jgi:phosphotransferase system HPr-like phosphotransfer protein
MVTLEIKLDTLNSVRSFNQIMMKQPYEVDVVSGRYVVDAKSFMGLLSLDLSHNLTLKCHTDDEDDIPDELSEFIAK